MNKTFLLISFFFCLFIFNSKLIAKTGTNKAQIQKKICLLKGKPKSKARLFIDEISLAVENPVYDTSSEGGQYIRNKVSVELTEECTVEELNKLMKTYNACILSAGGNNPVTTFEIPDPGSHEKYKQIFEKFKKNICINVMRPEFLIGPN